jgi:hypothetical protein
MTTEYKAGESGFHYIERNQGKWFVTGIEKRKFRVVDLKRLSSRNRGRQNQCRREVTETRKTKAL